MVDHCLPQLRQSFIQSLNYNADKDAFFIIISSSKTCFKMCLSERHSDFDIEAEIVSMHVGLLCISPYRSM